METESNEDVAQPPQGLNKQQDRVTHFPPTHADEAEKERSLQDVATLTRSLLMKARIPDMFEDWSIKRSIQQRIAKTKACFGIQRPTFLYLPERLYSRVELLPPNPIEDDEDTSRYEYKEVFFEQEEVAGDIDVPDPSSRTFIRGSVNSMPFLPGGEKWEVEVPEQRKQFLHEAKSFVWMREIESGNLPNIDIPGFKEFLNSQTADGATGSMEDEEQVGEIQMPDEAPQSITAENIFDGVLPMDSDDDDIVPEVPVGDETPVQNGTQHDTIGTEADLVTTDNAMQPDDHDERIDILDLVLKGELSVEEALGKPQKGQQVWATRQPVENLEEKWKELKPNLAMSYPFELDTFQKEAIVHMEEDHSVFVAAHTSAGKTVAAEYAFALAEKHCSRAVYTSPIKTISNQKFRDFSGHFDVGLITGDVSIRPESNCLIMTTEILRSMLYKGADIIRDIEWVIFDEVHYVNDAERGVVWEEVIIMLPEHIKLLLLSATVPNVLEFANWVGKTKQKVVHVTGTNKRPVPLEHALFYSGKFYTICTHEKYDPNGLKQAKEDHAKKTGTPKTKAEAKAALPTGRGQPSKQQKNPSQVRTGANQYKTAEMKLKSERSQWGELIEKFRKRDLLPMVAFCFSKKRCDALADSLRSLDLTTGSEKSEIHIFCDKSFSRLRSADRNLPQLLRVKEMLKRGLGVHHAGLLPIVKEVVEMLFCRGLIKVLFATETFAMGVNAPARAVVFQSIRKHDGREFRNLLPGEYTQMAGRAGRRGLDTVGTVVIACWEEPPAELELRKMLTGSATKLESQFRLTYSMILNLLRVEDLKIEDMMKRSFAEFHAQRAAPQDQRAIELGQKALKQLQNKPWPISPIGSTKEEVDEYVDLTMSINRISRMIQEDVMLSRGALSSLTNGRVVLIERNDAGITDVGIILKASPGEGKSKKKPFKNANQIFQEDSNAKKTIIRLVRDSPLEDPKKKQSESAVSSSITLQTKNNDPFSGMKAIGKKDDIDDLFSGMKLGGKKSNTANMLSLPYTGDSGGIPFSIQEIDPQEIVAIGKQKIDIDADAILVGNAGKTALAIHELQRLNSDSNLELLDPIADLKVNGLDIVSKIRKRQSLLESMLKLRPYKDPMLPEMVATIKSEKLLMSRLNLLSLKTSDASLSQMPEFHQRIKILQKMGYILSDKTVTMKGRVACEINSGSEMVGTEIIFAGVLADLSPQEAVALLSALVFQDKTESDFILDVPEKLAYAYEHATSIAWNAGALQNEAGLNIVPDEFVKETLNFGLMAVVYHWASGMPFSEICDLTDVMEGSIVRCIVRLDETCREFRDAARVMGDLKLYKQMEDASESIKRDIVFAASLYIT